MKNINVQAKALVLMGALMGIVLFSAPASALPGASFVDDIVRITWRPIAGSMGRFAPKGADDMAKIAIRFGKPTSKMVQHHGDDAFKVFQKASKAGLPQKSLGELAQYIEAHGKAGIAYITKNWKEIALGVGVYEIARREIRAEIGGEKGPLRKGLRLISLLIESGVLLVAAIIVVFLGMIFWKCALLFLHLWKRLFPRGRQ